MSDYLGLRAIMALPDDYLLPQDASETIRLYKAALGYLLNSKIPINNSIRTADVATGTGFVVSTRIFRENVINNSQDIPPRLNVLLSIP